MRSSGNQLDILRDDPKRLAQANRVAADTALRDVQFDEAERKRRHDYYMAEAERLEKV